MFVFESGIADHNSIHQDTCYWKYFYQFIGNCRLRLNISTMSVLFLNYICLVYCRETVHSIFIVEWGYFRSGRRHESMEPILYHGSICECSVPDNCLPPLTFISNGVVVPCHTCSVHWIFHCCFMWYGG